MSSDTPRTEASAKSFYEEEGIAGCHVGDMGQLERELAEAIRRRDEARACLRECVCALVRHSRRRRSV